MANDPKISPFNAATLHAMLRRRSSFADHIHAVQAEQAAWAETDRTTQANQALKLLQGLTPRARLAIGLKTASPTANAGEAAWTKRRVVPGMQDDLKKIWQQHFRAEGSAAQLVERLVEDASDSVSMTEWGDAAERYAYARGLQRQVDLHARPNSKPGPQSLALLVATARAFLNAPATASERQRVLYSLKVAKAFARKALRSNDLGTEKETAAFSLKVAALAVRWASHAASEKDRAPVEDSSATPLKPDAILPFPTSARLWNFAMQILPATTLENPAVAETLQAQYEIVAEQWSAEATHYALPPDDKPKLPRLPNVGPDMLDHLEALDLSDPHLPSGLTKLAANLQGRLKHPGDPLFANMPRNVLFYGASGTGKSYTALRLAKLLGRGVAVFVHPAVTLAKPFMGNSSQAILAVYDEAAKHALSIVIVDEIDLIAADQDVGGGSIESAAAQENQRMAGTFWSVLDDTHGKYKNVITIATTNRKERLGERLDNSRFPNPIHFELPGTQQVQEIIAQTSSKLQRSLAKRDVQHIAPLGVGLNARQIDDAVKSAFLQINATRSSAVSAIIAELLAAQQVRCAPAKQLPPMKPVEVDVDNGKGHQEGVSTVGVWVKGYQTLRQGLAKSPVVAAFQADVLMSPCAVTFNGSELSLFSTGRFAHLESIEICAHAPDGTCSESVVLEAGELAGATARMPYRQLSGVLAGLLSNTLTEEFSHDGSLLLGLRFTIKKAIES